MSTLITNSFSSYDLTDKEILTGSVLTTLQKQVLQNLQAVCAEEKLRLEFNVNNTLLFAQQESYKRAQIDLISYLLDASSSAELALNDPNSELNQNNPQK